jgi:hypothetical protein
MSALYVVDAMAGPIGMLPNHALLMLCSVLVDDYSIK